MQANDKIIQCEVIGIFWSTYDFTSPCPSSFCQLFCRHNVGPSIQLVCVRVGGWGWGWASLTEKPWSVTWTEKNITQVKLSLETKGRVYIKKEHYRRTHAPNDYLPSLNIQDGRNGRHFGYFTIVYGLQLQ